MKLSKLNPMNLFLWRDEWVAKRRRLLNKDIDQKLAMWGDCNSDYQKERRAKLASTPTNMDET